MKRILNAVFIMLFVILLVSCKKIDTTETNPVQSENYLDYFPIKLGSIRFKYTEEYESNSHWIHIDGESVWNISAASTRNDSTIYQIAETITKVYSNQGGFIKIDTISFQIIENNSHKIFLNKSFAPYYSYQINFKRYVNTNQPETIRLRQGDGFIDLKNNIGIYEIYLPGGGGWFMKYELM